MNSKTTQACNFLHRSATPCKWIKLPFLICSATTFPLLSYHSLLTSMGKTGKNVSLYTNLSKRGVLNQWHSPLVSIVIIIYKRRPSIMYIPPSCLAGPFYLLVSVYQMSPRIWMYRLLAWIHYQQPIAFCYRVPSTSVCSTFNNDQLFW